MKERPILFSAPMVRSILEGRKTVTRRVVRHQPPVTAEGDAAWRDQRADLWRNARQYARDCCPFGTPGDRLWVRETWALASPGMTTVYVGQVPKDGPPDGYEVVYGATLGHLPVPPWRSPIHMPRWASRILLEVTEVRVERLQDITEKDAIAEGVEDWGAGADGEPRFRAEGAVTEADPVPVFAQLWESLNAARGFPWASNPWVWRVAFRPVA